MWLGWKISDRFDGSSVIHICNRHDVNGIKYFWSYRRTNRRTELRIKDENKLKPIRFWGVCVDVFWCVNFQAIARFPMKREAHEIGSTQLWTRFGSPVIECSIFYVCGRIYRKRFISCLLPLAFFGGSSSFCVILCQRKRNIWNSMIYPPKMSNLWAPRQFFPDSLFIDIEPKHIE